VDEREDAHRSALVGRTGVTAFQDALATLTAVPGRAEPGDAQGTAAAFPNDPKDPPAERLDDVCTRLLADLRKRCPGLVPDDPLPAGTPGSVVPVAAGQAGQLVGTAIAQAVSMSAAGRLPAQQPPPSAVLWRDGIDSLLVQVSGISVKLQAGVVAVIIPVACDQLTGDDGPGASGGTGTVVVQIHVGMPDRPTGMLAATPERPDGPEVVVERWGVALTALAWRGLLDAAGGVAAAAGKDTDGTPLVPVALVASADGLAVLPQARQPFDRILPGKVVR
jgi:hypothetical protein